MIASPNPRHIQPKISIVLQVAIIQYIIGYNRELLGLSGLAIPLVPNDVGLGFHLGSPKSGADGIRECEYKTNDGDESEQQGTDTKSMA